MPASSDDLTPNQNVPAAAQLEGVTVTYGSTDALAGIDLQIDVGQRVALVGPSGAGKSSVLGVLSGLVTPTRGTVKVLNEEARNLRGRQLRSHRSRVGTVHQQLDLAGSLRVVHNVNAGRLGRWSNWSALSSLVRHQGTDEIAAVLDRVGIGQFLHTRTDLLSGGEQQRVAVARVLFQQPDLVLADEPVSAVDPKLSEDLLGLLCADDPAAPWTTVVSLHEPDLARRFATRVVGLSKGTIAFDRPAGDVTESDLNDLYSGRSR